MRHHDGNGGRPLVEDLVLLMCLSCIILGIVPCSPVPTRGLTHAPLNF